MAIFRGAGGAGDATTDSSSQALAAINAAAEAEVSATEAASSASAAATSATNAASSATAAASSASSASSSATSASTSATNAASSASDASDSESNAADSATAAATSATTATTKASEAASSATAAASSASAAATSATNAASSATAAAASASAASTSETNSAASETAAATSETNAASSESAAATSATNAANSATAAATSATNAANSATAAATSATNAATSATNASNSATAAATSETNAASSASAASTSATNAANSATSAATSATNAATSYDNFDDRYLGNKSSVPSVDNDGDPLLTGALYFDTTSNSMKVYNGTTWLDAYASLSGALLATNNLSDLSSVSTARTNLGLGTAATTDSTAYATAAQGTNADTAYGWGNHASAGYAADSLVMHLAGTETITGAKTFSSTITGSITGNAGTVTNGVYTTGSYADPSWITSIAGSKVSGNISGNAATATTATNQSGGTVAATTGSFSSSVTMSSGTANGVAYLNGSKVLTTGSALTFDGSVFSVDGTTKTNFLVGRNSLAAEANGYYFTLSSDYGQSVFKLSVHNYDVIKTFGYDTPSSIAFYASNTEQMRLTSTGLGIGTSSPSTKLDISVSDGVVASKWIAATGRLRLRPYVDSTLGATFESINTAENAYLPLSLYGSSVRLGNGAQVIIDSSGNLGLGVTPSAWGANYKALQIGAKSTFYYDTSNTVVGNNSYDTGGTHKYLTTAAANLYVMGGGSHVWYTAPSGTAGNAISFTQAMTLDASGNLGIGTSSPGALLDVSSTVSRTVNFNSTYANGVGVAFKNSGTDFAYMGSAKWVMSGSLSDFGIGTAGATNITFGTNNTERMRIDSSGNLQFNSGYGSVATAYGCRAWVNFNGTGTVAIRASGNVSSITDNGVGLYTVNFSNAMPDINYAISAFNHQSSGGSFVMYNYTNGGVQTTGYCRVGTGYSNVLTDCDSISVAVFR